MRSASRDPRQLLSDGRLLAGRAADEAFFVRLCVRSGLVRPERPSRIVAMARAFERHGLLAFALAAGAIRHPDAVVMRDERGAVTYGELDDGVNALANQWRDHGFTPGEGIAILARNHRWFLYAVYAAARCGAKIILLNTSFAGPQIREVAGREGSDLLVYDDEYAEMLEGVEPPRGRWRAWTDEPRDGAHDTLDWLIENGSTAPPPKPGANPRIVILTSGTTGTPKGAPRSEPKSLSVVGAILSKVPFRAGEVTILCAPMFHALGFAHMVFGMGLGSELVVHRRFDPEQTLRDLDGTGATAMIVVPVMLQRMLDLGEDEVRRHDLSRLRIIFVSGSQLGEDLVKRTQRAFGPVVYNLYGSTEVAYATIATPEDLSREPGTVGGVVRGSVVKVLDDDGEEVPAGVTGRIFVGNGSQFEGYTGGETKEQVAGLMSSGDVGHFDRAGRLFIDGRDDEMIISGGENVFPGEVEELLAGHPAVREVAAIGVDDDRFGQRLKAFVVLRDGQTLSEDEVKSYVSQNLARYKTPRDVIFIDELPRNPTGKILKRALTDVVPGAADADAAAGATADADAAAATDASS